MMPNLILVGRLLLGAALTLRTGTLRHQQQLLQDHPQRLLRIVGDGDQACRKVVPVADEVVQADDGGEDGGAQRQHDLEEAEVAQAVDLRRVMQLLRNGGFEEVSVPRSRCTRRPRLAG